jgi:hypothetical protein
VQSSSFRFGVSGFVPKTQIFTLETRLNQPSTDYPNEKNKTISNFALTGTTPQQSKQVRVCQELKNIFINVRGCVQVECSVRAKTK